MKLDRIISIATLGSSVIAIWLVLKKPQPVAPPQSPAAIAANAESLQNKLQEFNEPKQPGQPPAQVRLTSEEVGAALAQAAGAMTGSAMPASAGCSWPCTSTFTNAGVRPRSSRRRTWTRVWTMRKSGEFNREPS